jgi:hypothetical protein
VTKKHMFKQFKIFFKKYNSRLIRENLLDCSKFGDGFGREVKYDGFEEQ